MTDMIVTPRQVPPPEDTIPVVCCTVSDATPGIQYVTAAGYEGWISVLDVRRRGDTYRVARRHDGTTLAVFGSPYPGAETPIGLCWYRNKNGTWEGYSSRERALAALVAHHLTKKR